MKLKLVIMIVGLGGGAALMHFFGGQARQAVGLEGRAVEANVLEESRDEDGRLVLMLESDGESMLATFRERADDVASLVHVGDVISFRAPVNGVFSDDVPLLSVRRGGAQEGEEQEPDEVDAEDESASQDLETLEEPEGEVTEDSDADPAVVEEANEVDEESLDPVADGTSGTRDPQSAES